MTVTLVLQKGFTLKNIYVKYESSITYHSKAMASVKKFLWTNKWTGQKLYAPNLSMQGHKKKIISSEGKVTHTF